MRKRVKSSLAKNKKTTRERTHTKMGGSVLPTTVDPAPLGRVASPHTPPAGSGSGSMDVHQVQDVELELKETQEEEQSDELAALSLGELLDTYCYSASGGGGFGC